jgi:hypothetical protein
VEAILRDVPIPEILAFVIGAAVVARTILSAVRAFLLPRASHDRVARFVFRTTRRLFNVFAGPSVPYAERDRVLAYKGPISLVLLPGTWLFLIACGYAAMFWAVGVGSPWDAFATSGSTLLTLGFIRPVGPAAELLGFTEAVMGPTLLALLVSYLPTIYAGFSRRELLVSLLEVRADSPPSPIVLITRFHRLDGLDALSDMWAEWERWFVELSETHTSLTILVDYRSQQADHSWVNAAGAMLDAAAIVRSAVAVPHDLRMDLMLRAGCGSLRQIADAFSLPYDPDPSPDHPTSIDRARFEAAVAVLALAGVPLLPDRDEAWREFDGWRARYDVPLRALERLTVAPTPWWERPMHPAQLTDERSTGAAGPASIA